MKDCESQTAGKLLFYSENIYNIGSFFRFSYSGHTFSPKTKVPFSDKGLFKSRNLLF